MTRPYELLARFGNDGSVAGVSVRTITTINGKDYESDPQPLSGATDDAFVAFATQFSASVEAENTTLKADLATANATIEQLQAKITALEAIRAFNPRWTTPDFFQNRFTVKTARMFERSDDPVIAGGRDLLDEYELRGYHVDLDDAQVQGLTAYMVQLGMLTEAERTHVLRDVSAAEAWYPE